MMPASCETFAPLPLDDRSRDLARFLPPLPSNNPAFNVDLQSCQRDAP
jgi:hypothetical protein